MTNGPVPIRIAHVIARLNVGGAALHVMMLAGELRKPTYGGLDNPLICGVIGEGEADMRYVADGLGLTVYTIPELGREISMRGDLITLFKLIGLFRRLKPQVVHTNTAKAGLVGRLAARIAGVPVVIHTFHGHVFSGYFSRRKTQVFIVLERMAARLSDAVITPSAELKRQITADYHICKPEKVRVVPIGFDLDQFVRYDRSRSTFRADHRIPPDAPLIGIVGRLVPIKNHDLFIQAAARVHAARPEVHFVLIGDGERRDAIQALVAELGLADVVTFAGWVVDTPPVYAVLDVLALSSRNEGVPVSIIEAMAAGVPVVSTQVGGVPDLIARPEFGFAVPPDDPAALADGMLAALARGVAEHRLDLEGARQHVLATYGIAPVARAHHALYVELLRRRGFSLPALATPATSTGP